MRTLQFGLAGVASVAVISTAVLALWLVGSATGDRERFSSLEIAPQDAVFYMAINTDPTSSQWLAVDNVLGTLNAKDPIRKAIDEELAKFDLEFERDILPLAGDEGYLAVTDVERLAAESGGFLAGFRLRDTARTEEIFLDIAEQEGSEYSEEEYEGETIYKELGVDLDGDNVGDVSQVQNSAISFAGDVMVIGTSREDVKAGIDVIQGRAPNAVGNERLQELRARQEEDFLVWGYGDVGQVLDAFRGQIEQGLSGSGTRVPDPIDVTEIPAPPPQPDPAPQTADFRITSFDSEYTIDANGSFLVKETIAVDFGTNEKHGLYRDLPNRTSYDFTNDEEIRVDDFSATRNGAAEAFEGELAGDQFRILVGDPNATISGQHTYVFQYKLAGGIQQHISDGPDAYYELRWIPTGNDWPVAIENASATVTVPSGTIDFADCHVGIGEFGEENFMPCEATHEGLTARFVLDGPIEPGAGLHIDVAVNGDIDAPPPVLVPVEDPFGDIEIPAEEDPVNDFPLAPAAATELFDEIRGYYDRLSFAVSARNDGFVADVNVIQQEGADLRPAYGGTPFDSDFVNRVPADAMAFFTGYDLYNGSYIPTGDLFDRLGSGGDEFDNAIGDIEAEVGFDLEDDLLSLMTGEYAVAFNASGFDTEQPEFDVLALVDVNDGEKIAGTMEKVGEFLEQQDLARVEDGTREGVRLWSPVDAPESAAWTVDDNTLAVGYPESSVDGFLDGVDDSLADSADWKRTMELLPEDKTAVFYVSLTRIIEEVRRIEGIDEQFETSTEGELSLADLEPVKTLAWASTAEEDGYGIRMVFLVED